MDAHFYSHVNFSVTKITFVYLLHAHIFYSHVNFSVTKISSLASSGCSFFYSHVNFSVTKIDEKTNQTAYTFTVT